MALGEYLSVSGQSDSQEAMIVLERHEFAIDLDSELREVGGFAASHRQRP